MNKLLLGRYIHADSFVHKLDARAKLFLSFYFIVIIFLCNNWQTYTLLGILTLVSVVCSEIKLKFFWDGIRPLVWLIIFTVVLQLFFSSGSHVYWQWGIFRITSLGIENAIYIFCRFVLIICMSTLLTLTTPPLQIADGMEALMKPLKKVKVPVDEIALMLSIALRFVPTLMDETTKIMNAQRSRGVNFEEGSLWHRAKMLVPLLIPLFVSSFNRAEDLAIAMEARGYRGGSHRTKYRQQVWHRNDTLVMMLFAVVTGLLIYLRK
ncbi:cobalt ABC transporter ATP-binding protein [Ligilactobacillus saerimneri]|uniref:Energy-coupling factor transporter transmembrane protein EcfT n=1 Tax=Ligilactobacillus saerimneri TaxID=228229 RepID=A0A7H9EL13_9LACO|nr:energy-coupling factor transporter transmembrane component T [Ligilactobacillus saerimneri]QLL78374.1 cobalt ABC transporter ATP-binding protein [Ligilactobacillus saerimneri]